MHIEQIGEAVKVRADFQGGGVRPVLVRRGRELHRITRVHACWEHRQGCHKVLHFSVSVECGDVYQLRFNSGDLLWFLDSVAMEG